MKAAQCLTAAGAALAGSFLLSFVHLSAPPNPSGKPSGELLAGAVLPPRVRQIIQHKCADCHSQQGNLPLYGRFAPASWLLEHDVAAARSHWDASHWSDYSADEQMQLLSRLAIRAKLACMPPARYRLLHPGTRLVATESKSLYDWAKAEKHRLRSLHLQAATTNAIPN